jgi:hypothetical protein
MVSILKTTGSRSYLPSTLNNSIGNATSLSYIDIRFKPQLQEIIETYKGVFLEDLHSLYLRGSLITQNPHNPIDVDVFAVTKSPIVEEDAKDLAKRLERITKKYGLKVDDSSIAFDTLFNDPGVGYYRSFEIKTQGKCIYGNDLTEEIAEYILNKQTCYKLLDDLFDLRSKVNQKLLGCMSEECLSKVASSAYKRILRNSYLLIAIEVGKFTRDITTCYLDLKKSFPSNSECFEHMFHHSFNEYTDSPKDKIEKTLDQFYLWYEKELNNFKDSIHEG